METTPITFDQCLALQRAAHRANPYPDLEQRKADLGALHQFLDENEAAIIEAIGNDFGVRPGTETRLIELFPVRQGIRDTLGHLAKWMRSKRRSVDQLVFPGTSNRVIAQPLGVVGVMVPWNFPIFLSFGSARGHPRRRQPRDGEDVGSVHAPCAPADRSLPALPAAGGRSPSSKTSDAARTFPSSSSTT